MNLEEVFGHIDPFLDENIVEGVPAVGVLVVGSQLGVTSADNKITISGYPAAVANGVASYLLAPDSAIGASEFRKILQNALRKFLELATDEQVDNLFLTSPENGSTLTQQLLERVKNVIKNSVKYNDAVIPKN